MSGAAWRVVCRHGSLYGNLLASGPVRPINFDLLHYFHTIAIMGLFRQIAFATCAQPDLPAGISVRAVVAELVDAQR
jgi:hypothetical protein